MSREPLPDRIKNAPKLFAGLQLYFQAFFDLDAERSHQFGFQAIPRSAIVNYCDELELDDEQRADMLHHVRGMDRAHLARLEANRPQPQGK